MSLSRPVALPATAPAAAPSAARVRAAASVDAREAALVVGLVLAALALRLPYLWTVPRFTDETREVLRALALARGELVGLEALVNLDAYIGGLYNWLLAGIFALGGPSPHAPRLLVAVAGALTVGATYLLARDLGGRLAGIVAAALLATAGGHILSVGHIAWSHCLTPLFSTLAAWLLLRAVRATGVPPVGQDAARGAHLRPGDARAGASASGDAGETAARRGDGRWALLGSGLLFGLALQTHPATLVLLPGAAVYVLWRGRRLLRTPWPYLALGLFVLANANLVVYNLATGGNTFTEASEVRDVYSRGRSIFMDAGTYAATQVTHGTMLLAYLAGAVDGRGPVDSRGMPRSLLPYLLDPTLPLYGALSLAGLMYAARRGAPLLGLMALSSVLVMPYFNERKYVPISDGRYLMPLLPLAFAGVGLLVASIWRAAEARGGAARAAVGIAALLLVLWPLVPLARHYGQEVAAGRTNEPLWDVRARVLAERRPGEAVLLDRDLSEVKLEGGGTAFRAIRFLLATSGVDDQSVDNLPDYARRMRPGATALIVTDATAFAAFDRELARVAEYGVSGAPVSAPPGPGGFGLHRIERDPRATVADARDAARADGGSGDDGPADATGRAPSAVAAGGAAAGPRGMGTYALLPEAGPAGAAGARAAPAQAPADRAGDDLARQGIGPAGKPAEGLTVEVFATGFVNPRGIAFRSDGSMFVAEAGTGGPRAVEVGRDKPHQIGRTGAIVRLTPGGDRFSMAHNLPSIVTAVGEEVGPSALAFIGDTLYVLTASGGWDVGDPAFNSGIFRLTPDGRLDEVFDYTEFVKANPSRSRREDPRADVPFGMPYGLTVLDGKLYTTDGNQEQVFEVDPATGAARQVAEYPRSNRALTGISAGPDGALYVAEFAANKVTRVTTDGRIGDAATKLRTPIATAFDPEGRLYVLEYTGRLLRAAPVGEEQRDILIEGMNKPTAMAFGPDGNLYVAVNGHGAARGEGQIVRVKLAPDPPGHMLRFLPPALSWGIGLGVFALMLFVGWRSRERVKPA